MIKIGIIVAWDSPFIWTAPAFNMMNWERPEGCEVNFIMGVGWCPAARHNDGVAKAQEWGADLIAFNGGDHLCPKDLLVKMKARIDEGWDMVHVMVASRGNCGHNLEPFQSISYKMVGPLTSNFITNCPKDSIKIVSWDDEPQETHVCGTGNIMMKAEILDGLERPYFEEFIKKDKLYGREAVQDSQFVSRCTINGGAKMFCDTSIKLIHLDVFGIDETYNSRFKDKAGKKGWSPAKELREYV